MGDWSRRRFPGRPVAVCGVVLAVATVLGVAPAPTDKASLSRKLWPPGRIQEAIKAVEEQHRTDC